MRELNVIICGVGGQGNLLIERIIGKSAIKEGYFVRAADTFGASQRGGSVLSHVRIGSGVSSSLVPQGRCHIILGLEPSDTLDAAVKFLRKDGLVIVNIAPVPPAKVKVDEWAYPSLEIILGLLKELTPNVIDLDATALARKTVGSERAMNILMTGVLIGVGALPISPDTVREEIKQISDRLVQANTKAFEVGFEIGKERRLVKFAKTR